MAIPCCGCPRGSEQWGRVAMSEARWSPTWKCALASVDEGQGCCPHSTERPQPAHRTASPGQRRPLPPPPVPLPAQSGEGQGGCRQSHAQLKSQSCLTRSDRPGQHPAWTRGTPLLISQLPGSVRRVFHNQPTYQVSSLIQGQAAGQWRLQLPRLIHHVWPNGSL